MKASMIASVFSVAVAVDLTWSDCGDADTHATVTDLQPTHLDLGGTTTLVGSGTLDADQAGGTFKFVAKAGPIPVLKGSGNLCEDTTIKFPLGAGSIVFHGLDCPVAAGDISLTLDVEVLGDSASNALLDISLTAESDTGDKLVCMDIKGSNLEEKVNGGSLSLSWTDCGGSSTHAKTTDVQPSSLELGADTAIIGTGDLDKTVSGGTYNMELKAGGGLIHSHFTGNTCEAKDFTLPLGLGTLSWDGISCPMAAASGVNIGFHTKLAASLPAALATSTIHVEAVDQDQEQVLCVDLKLAKQDIFQV
jgi:hypothetical protein